ncbi:hypothetical protein [Flocculibacter collagenilyticus]|uniref:hypothetical protein n=1 Tax=Flocculibacter collagenilyticus TaxID=2744479 RepID=UPI0018F3D350|nr:hypothetical protein [Flocculibacter collagenilyticus]
MNKYTCKGKEGSFYQLHTNQTDQGWTIDITFDIVDNNHLQNIHFYSESYFPSEEDAIKTGQQIYNEESRKLK